MASHIRQAEKTAHDMEQEEEEEEEEELEIRQDCNNNVLIYHLYSIPGNFNNNFKFA